MLQRCGACGARNSVSGSASCHWGASEIMSVPLDPKPCNSKTIFFGALPERGCRLAPFTIFDKYDLFPVAEGYLVIGSSLDKP